MAAISSARFLGLRAPSCPALQKVSKPSISTCSLVFPRTAPPSVEAPLLSTRTFTSLHHFPLRSGPCHAAASASDGASTAAPAAGSATIQFIRGVDELVVPDVKLTKSRDGASGTATFVFDNPSVFDQSRELGDITGLFLVDDEGVISSIDVSAKFINGKPARIEARLVMRSTREWDRFMRFMERYAEQNSLGFVKS